MLEQNFHGNFGNKEVDFEGRVYKREDGLVFLPMKDITSDIKRTAIGILSQNKLKFLKFADSLGLAPIFYSLEGKEDSYEGYWKAIASIFLTSLLHKDIPEIEKYFEGKMSVNEIVEGVQLSVIAKTVKTVEETLGEANKQRASLVIK